MTHTDYDYYDFIIAMDRNNLRNMQRIVGPDVDGKISLLMDYTSTPRDVADPSKEVRPSAAQKCAIYRLPFTVSQLLPGRKIQYWCA